LVKKEWLATFPSRQSSPGSNFLISSLFLPHSSAIFLSDNPALNLFCTVSPHWRHPSQGEPDFEAAAAALGATVEELQTA